MVVVVVVVVVRSRVSGTAEPNLLFGSIWTFENIFISPTHKRTEGRAPVWGSEFTTKVATRRGDSAEIAATLNVKLWVLGVVRGGVLPVFWNSRAQSIF